MAKTSPVGNGGISSRVFTADERAADPAGKVLQISDVNMRAIAASQDQDKIRRALEAAGDNFNSYDFLRNIRLPRKNPSPTGAFSQQQALYFAGESESSLAEFEANLRSAGVPEYLIQEQITAGSQYNPVDPTNEYLYDKHYRMRVALGEIVDVQQSVSLTDIPTSSSNFKRPRTVAAGWDPDTHTLTVVFRDGTFWNYYEVPESVWIKFHFAFSKGPFVNTGGDLLSYANGPADPSQLNEQMKRELYKASRLAQIVDREAAPRVNPATNAPYSSGRKPTRGTPGSQGNKGLRRRSNLALGTVPNPTKPAGQGSIARNPSRNNGKNPNQK